MSNYKYQLVSVRNAKLEKDGIASINMPPVLTCPMAGECKKYCYAQVGQQAMGSPKEFRLRALELYKNDPKKFEEIAKAEIHRSGRRIIRWHDSGDIMHLTYLKMMIRIANHFPEVKFYSYTKSISIVKKIGFKNLPVNLKLIQSYGGKEDQLIDRKYPFAEIFLFEDLIPKNYCNASHSDYLPATSTVKKIGIAVHGIRKKRFTSEV